MGRPFVPIHQLAQRPPVQGKIRMGEKGSKGQPQKLTDFRFTTADKDALQQVADLYGGEVKPWPEMKGQWQVKTEASEINVVLPKEPLAPITYEVWSGGGIQRRCDGVTVEIPQKTGGGAGFVQSPCICNAKEQYDCKPKIRLSVVLPEVKFGGVWLLESSSWNAAYELPGMVSMIQEIQTRNFQRAVLAIEQRSKKTPQGVRHFIVPVLRPSVSMVELMEGGGSLLALAAAPDAKPQLTDGTEGQDRESYSDTQDRENYTVDTSWEDDDIVDAEIVEEVGSASPVGSEHSAETSSTLETKRKRMHVLLKELGMGAIERHAITMRITNGRSSSSNDLDEGGLDMMIAALTAMRKAEAFFEGVDEQGFAVVSRR